MPREASRTADPTAQKALFETAYTGDDPVDAAAVSLRPPADSGRPKAGSSTDLTDITPTRNQRVADSYQFTVDVFQTVCDRLAGKAADLRLLVEADESFEEWLDWEAFLACKLR